MDEHYALVEQIIYTASLVTKTQDVDPLLDNLREVTSRINRTQPLSEADKSKLLQVQYGLENYLLTHEVARFFTPESLKLQIELHMKGDYLKKSRFQLWSIVVIAVGTALGLAIFLPLDTPDQRGLVGGATAFSLLTVGAASLFLTALPAFQSSLRYAFGLICAGVTLLGLSLLGQPILEIFGLRHYPLASLLYTLPLLIAAILFHAGDTMYLRLIGVKSWWATAYPVVGAAVVIALLSWFMPHPPTAEPEVVHDLVAAMWGVMLLMPAASAIVLPMAIPKISELYKPSIRLLHQAMFPIILVVLYQYVLRIVAGPYMHGAVAYILFGLITLMGLALMRAGYTFNKVSRY